MPLLSHYLKTITLLTLAAVVTGCSIPTKNMRQNHANDIASQSNMSKTIISAPPFEFTTYQKIKAPQYHTANIYIEGDGLAWITRRRISSDPTPSRPIALQLAILDPAPNVIYIARPCQYSGMSDSTKYCTNQYWTSHRFAPEIIQSINTVLDKLKSTHDFKKFNLIGFSGGAAVAILLAASRNDIHSIRTIAGNLDHEKVSEIHHVSPLTGSLNPADVSEQINYIPQSHFTGEDDRIVTSEVSKSYLHNAKDTHCIQVLELENTTHESGWTRVWGELLLRPVVCSH